MAVKTFSTNELLTSSDTNTYLANSGLVYITQVTVGSGVATVNITGCFSATYDHYLVQWAGVTCSNAANAMLYKLLVGTTPTTAGFYGNTMFLVNGGGGGFTNANRVNTSFAECGGISTTYLASGSVEIHQPFISSSTWSSFSHVDNYYWRLGVDVLHNTTSYNGFQLYPGLGTISGGTITVYGYRKG